MRLLASPQSRPAAVPPGAAAAPLSFEAIFRSHARLVGRWAQRLGGPGVEADETVQQVFVTVNRRLAAFRGDEKVTSWLFQITTRVVANQRRAVRRRRSRWAALSLQVSDRAMSSAPGPAEILEAREAAERFYRVLDRLRENHRNVLVLFELEELSTEQIAALVGRPPATVRVWLHRARAAFAKGWQGQSNIEGDDVSEREES
jgi:RNA polymerase sigma-70 factor (ECF subfamily)